MATVLPDAIFRWTNWSNVEARQTFIAQGEPPHIGMVLEGLNADGRHELQTANSNLALADKPRPASFLVGLARLLVNQADPALERDLNHSGVGVQDTFVAYEVGQYAAEESRGNTQTRKNDVFVLEDGDLGIKQAG